MGEPVSFPISKQSSLSENMKYFPKARTECSATQVLCPLVPECCRWGGQGGAPGGPLLPSKTPCLHAPLGTGLRKSWGGVCLQPQCPGCGAKRLHSCGRGDARPRDTPRAGTQESLLGKAALNMQEAETRQLPGSDLGTKAGACSLPPSPATPGGPPAGRGAAPSRAAAEWSPPGRPESPLAPSEHLQGPAASGGGGSGQGQPGPASQQFPTSRPPEFPPSRPPVSPAGEVGAQRGLGVLSGTCWVQTNILEGELDTEEVSAEWLSRPGPMAVNSGGGERWGTHFVLTHTHSHRHSLPAHSKSCSPWSALPTPSPRAGGFPGYPSRRIDTAASSLSLVWRPH